MMRTNYTSQLHNLQRFISGNYRLLLLAAVFFIGVAAGIAAFSADNRALCEQLGQMLSGMHTVGSFANALSELAVSCTLPLLLMLVLGLSGLSVCGIPVSLLCIGVYGCSVGMTEAYFYASGPSGIVVTLLLLLPRTVIAAIALLMAASESLRMSALLGRQVLPSGVGSSLWNDLKMYGVRFLLCSLLAVISGLADIGCRLLFGGLVAQL